MNLNDKLNYYQKRTKNVQNIEEAIDLLEKQIKHCIVKEGYENNLILKQKIEKEIELYTKLLSGLVVIWSEALIKTLFYEYGAFEDEQIYKLMDKHLNEKWKTALVCAFYKSFSGETYDPLTPIQNKAAITSLTTIDESIIQKFATLYNLITNKLEPAISVRNKISHGDWISAFKEVKYKKENDVLVLKQTPDFDEDMTEKIESENILTLHLKRNQFRAMYGLIKDLAVFKRYGGFKPDNSKTPFEFNFDKRYRQILSNQKHIENADYSKYRQNLVLSSQRGDIWKEKNKKKQSFFEKILSFFEKKT